MTFLYPWFLLSLFAILIPIIIHLFRFRKFRKVYFPSISFLEQINDQTRKQSKLKHLLVLFSRILAIVFLVLAFARPYIPSASQLNSVGENRVSVYLDNSYSMEPSSDFGSYLEFAKEQTEIIAENMNPTDRFHLITNDFLAQHQRYASRDEFLDMVNRVRFSSSLKEINAIQERQKALDEENVTGAETVFLLSDFQKSVFDLQNLQPDTNKTYFLVPFNNQVTRNIYIDSVWTESPVHLSGQPHTLHVRVMNVSDDQIENQPLRLEVNNEQRAVATYDIGPQSFTDVLLTFTPDQKRFQNLVISISDYPVSFDDRFFASFQLTRDINVLVVNDGEENRFLNTLFARDSIVGLEQTDVSMLDYNRFGRQNLIILNELQEIPASLSISLDEYLDEGGDILVLPAEGIDRESYNQFLASLDAPAYGETDTTSTRVETINTEHYLYKDVFSDIPENLDLPVVQKRYPLNMSTVMVFESLLRLQDGSAFFISQPVNSGNLFLSTVPLDDSFSNFQRHPVFVPTLYNISLYSNDFYPMWYSLNSDDFIPVRNYNPESGDLFKISADNFEMIPGTRSTGNTVRLFLFNQISQAGHYRLSAGDSMLRTLAFNYDKRESELQGYSVDELEEIITNNDWENVFVLNTWSDVSLDAQLNRLERGEQLWKVFLLIALFFILCEVLLLRFWKQ